MQLSTLAAHLNAELQGADTTFTSVSTDSRNIKPGEFFIALLRVKTLMDINFLSKQ